METLHKHNFYVKWEYLKKQISKTFMGEYYTTTTTYIGHKVHVLTMADLVYIVVLNDTTFA